jgi:hypothetical protein
MNLVIAVWVSDIKSPDQGTKFVSIIVINLDIAMLAPKTRYN